MKNPSFHQISNIIRMPVGTDQQYDLSWYEQDKVRRRLDLKYRIKQEGIRKRFDPFLQIKHEVYTDPAVDRYMDLRKKGRMPGAPFGPKLFFTLVATTTLPLFAIYYIMDWERRDFLRDCASGDYPMEKRMNKSCGC